jgi:hypothetical protein
MAHESRRMDVWMINESMLPFGGQEDVVRRLGYLGIVCEVMVMAIVVLLSASSGPV